nr:unnamed protein product [Callosobruchus chinensis]
MDCLVIYLLSLRVLPYSLFKSLVNKLPLPNLPLAAAGL